MEPLLSAYAEFEQPDKASELVRKLGDAGFHTIEINTLAAGVAPPRDFGQASHRKTVRYMLRGIWYGSTGGIMVAVLVFLIPASYLNIRHPFLTIAAAILVCAMAGASIGIAEALTLVKRTTPDPISLRNKDTVSVRVRVETLAELTRVKQIFSTITQQQPV